MTNIAITAIPFSSLQKQLSSKTISPAFITKMKKEAGIQTLQDIRNAGGIPDKEKMTAKEQETARHLEAHAYLNLLSEEVEVNEKLINAGISSFGAIAGTNKATFLERARGLGIPEEKAAALHAKAEAAEAYLTHIITAARAEKASYSTITPITQALGDEYDPECEVKECNSAVSPLAYLMELLVYAKANINGLGVNPFGTLEQKLYQPFERFTNACEEVDRKVRQVRIATEVLRRTGLNALPEDQTAYCFNAYKALLTQIGTSYDELRRIKSADAKKRQALADRLGIPLERVDGLLLKREELDETKLERLFGLQDTRRDVISSGIPEFHTYFGIQGWNFWGVEWSVNTDNDGNIFISSFIIGANPEKRNIKIYKDAEKTQLIAQGESTELTGKVTITQQNDSGLNGEMTFNQAVPGGNMNISLIPDFLTWRLQYLRQQWQTQDSLSDAYINKELPVIDPDLIGPEDFRHPEDSNLAFKLWKKRRDWVDGLHDKIFDSPSIDDALLILTNFISYRKEGNTTNSIITIIKEPKKGPGQIAFYFVRPWESVEPQLYTELIKEKRTELRKGLNVDSNKTWINEHYLTMDGFNHLGELIEKSGSNIALTNDEWEEVVDILVQVVKKSFATIWIEEKVSLSQPSLVKPFVPQLNPFYFWVALQEPEEGFWSSQLTLPEYPIIDPETIKKEALACEAVGKKAHDLWDRRAEQLSTFKENISGDIKTGKPGIVSALNIALGFISTNDLYTLDWWETEFKKEPAYWDSYGFSIDDFSTLFSFWQKQVFTEDDIEKTSMLLTTKYKQRVLWVTWEGEEKELSYWQIFRSRLPKWRASREERAMWQMALKRRSKVPIIDPDLVSSENIKSDKASKLFATRQTELNKKISGYESVQSVQPNGKLKELIVSELDTTTDELLALEATAQSGTDITKRLDQLSLSYAAFARLLDCWKMMPDGADLEESEWTEIYDILIQVLKNRTLYHQWQTKEKENGITLSPDFFELPEKPEGKFTPIPWRSTSEDRWDWEDKLQTRIDQEKGTYATMAEAVDKAEERTITQLKEALVEAAAVETPKAKTLSQQLLVDMEISPCQKTTRVSVAITTLQKLFFQLRMNEKSPSLSDISLNDTDFDIKWKWLGSYETWRAAVGVFLYPENVLLPSLSRVKTPVFDSIIKEVRSGSGITPAKAQGYAQIYADYFEDICTLENVISTTAPAKVTYRNPDGSLNTNERTILFKFGIGGKSKQVYWSYYDEGHKNDLDAIYSDSFWDVIPGMENIKVDKICGAPDYKISDKKLYLLLFVQYKDAFSKNKFSFFKFDLEIFVWDTESITLVTPNNNFFAVIQQDYNFENPPLIIIQDLSYPNAIYARQLNLDISDWEDGEWIDFMVLNPSKTLTKDNTSKTEIRFALSHTSFYPEYKPLKYNGVIMFKIFDKIDYDYYFADTKHISAFSEGIEKVTASVVCKNEMGEHYYYIFTNDPSTGHEKCKKLSNISLLENTVNLFIKNDNDTYEEGYIKESDTDSLNGLMNDIFGFSLENIKIPYFSEEFQDFRSDIQDIGLEKIENISSLFSVCCKLLYTDQFDKNIIFKWVTEIKNWLISKPDEFEWNDNIDHSIDWEFYKGHNGNRFIDFIAGYYYWPIPFSKVTTIPVDEEDKYYKLIYYTTQVGKEEPTITKSNSTFFLCPNYGWHAVKDWGNWNTIARQQNGQVQRCKYLILEKSNKVDVILSLKLTPISNYFDIYTLNEGYGKHRQEIIKIFENNNIKNLNGYNDELNRYIQQIIQEAFYFVPMFLALQLANKSYYNDALDWFRSIYDFQAPQGSRKIYYGLELENEIPPSDALPSSDIGESINFLDPTDVHGIASALGRYNSYTRFTLQSIIQTLLAYADYEFTRDTPESIEKALLLYEKTKELLDSPELHPYSAKCKQEEKAIAAQARLLPPSLAKRMIASLKKGNNLRLLQSVLELAAIYANDKKEETLQEIEKLLDTTHKRPLSIAEIVQRNGVALETTRQKLLKDASIERGLIQAVEATTYSSSGSSASSPYFLPKVATYGDFPVPYNPMIQMLYLHAENNLNKIRNCRNIAGIKREVEAYAAATDVQSAMPSIGAGGQLVLPTSILPPPVPYRYEFIIDRAKQLVNIAVQMENAFLNALEKKDAGLYEQLIARQDLQLAQSGVKLQNLRLRQAKDEIGLAEFQREQAEFQMNHFQNLLDQGESDLEIMALILQGLAITSELMASFSSIEASSGLGHFASASSIAASAALNLASFQRRKEEWEFQTNLARIGTEIGDQQIKIANDGVDITEQDVAISKLHVDQAKDIIEFLREKDTSAELYDWMQGILRGIYSYFLQQATAMAKLAQNQLAFERQEPSPGFIQHDYWVVPSENAMGGASENATDRFGLTGSARLLADIYKLDQYHFDTEKRKLQLTKNISLAKVAPFELQRFRETGVLTFQTLLGWFDRDFPGHYLRMIKRVRTSVIALVPPTEGIKATLSNIGVSRIVTERNGLYQTIIAHRPPESVALTSPSNATGLFELESQNTSMMLPFEGLGVDTLWEFRMPKAANQFDYSTIADIILSIDYTALDSYDYRQLVIESLPRKFSGDRPYSFRHQFADAWYDLHNPEQSANPMTVTFRTSREDFPPNLEKVTIQQVLLYFAVKDKAMDEQVVSLTFLAEVGESVALGGNASPVDGIISTRRGNGSAWMMIQGQPVAGTWTLSLPPNSWEVKQLFAEEKITDILLVITAGGVTPEWPV